MLEAINAREADLAGASDSELRDRAASLRGQAPDGLLPDVFALVRETARRVLGERPYDVQMLAGISLHQGKLVEIGCGTCWTIAYVPANSLGGKVTCPQARAGEQGLL